MRVPGQQGLPLGMFHFPFLSCSTLHAQGFKLSLSLKTHLTGHILEQWLPPVTTHPTGKATRSRERKGVNHDHLLRNKHNNLSPIPCSF